MRKERPTAAASVKDRAPAARPALDLGWSVLIAQDRCPLAGAFQVVTQRGHLLATGARVVRARRVGTNLAPVSGRTGRGRRFGLGAMNDRRRVLRDPTGGAVLAKLSEARAPSLASSAWHSDLGAGEGARGVGPCGYNPAITRISHGSASILLLCRISM